MPNRKPTPAKKPSPKKSSPKKSLAPKPPTKRPLAKKPAALKRPAAKRPPAKRRTTKSAAIAATPSSTAAVTASTPPESIAAIATPPRAATAVTAVTAVTQRQPLYVLSDSTGNLGRHTLTALLTQFPADAFHLEVRSFLRSPEQIAKLMEQIAAKPGMVFHGMLDREHKRLIDAGCRQIGIGCCDLTGPFVQFIREHSGLEPGQNYELLHNVDEAYHRRMGALEFTLAHDDALGMDSLAEAEIILVGISRTSKTPTSIYLAQLGYRVANIAIAIEVAPPEALLQIREKKIVGLVIEPKTLTEIRARRSREWRMDATNYTDPREVAKEVAWSRALFMKQHWPILDITNQAVEETAGRIVNVLGLTTA